MGEAGAGHDAMRGIGMVDRREHAPGRAGGSEIDRLAEPFARDEGGEPRPASRSPRARARGPSRRPARAAPGRFPRSRRPGARRPALLICARRMLPSPCCRSVRSRPIARAWQPTCPRAIIGVPRGECGREEAAEMDSVTSAYESAHRRLARRPGSVVGGEGGAASTGTRRWDRVFDPGSGPYRALVPGRHAQHLP